MQAQLLSYLVEMCWKEQVKVRSLSQGGGNNSRERRKSVDVMEGKKNRNVRRKGTKIRTKTGRFFTVFIIFWTLKQNKKIQTILNSHI